MTFTSVHVAAPPLHRPTLSLCAAHVRSRLDSRLKARIWVAQKLLSILTICVRGWTQDLYLDYRKDHMSSLSTLSLSQALAATALCVFITGCSEDPLPDGVLIELAPDLISSAEGTMHVRALVADDRSPQSGEWVRFEVQYTDRNGEDHAIEAVSGETDKRGGFEAVLAGFDFEGTGTVTATVLNGDQPLLGAGDLPVSATASFSVADNSPPTALILPPTNDLVVGAGFPLDVLVEVEDEIGISEVFVEAAGELNKLRSTVVASGEKTATIRFEFDIPRDAIAGPTITLNAMVADLSGNLSAAEPVVLTVDPAAEIGVPNGLVGDILTSGNNDFLDNPSALAVSPMDGKIYVADNSGNNPCQGACIRVLDATTGNVEAGALVQGNGNIEGVAFNADGSKLYYSDNQSRIVELSWNGGAMTYDSPASCNDFNADNPQDPFHLIHDATLGILVTDQQDKVVKAKAVCDLNDPQDLTNGTLDQPHGSASGGAATEFYVSDSNLDRVFLISDQGDLSLFGGFFDNPRGIVWNAGGTSAFADSLLVTERDRQTVASTQGSGKRTVAFMRNDPVDVDVVAGTMYILTEPSNGDRGRVFIVTGL